jgi:hypothetical protein
MAVSHAFPSPEPRDDERYYLPPRILAAVRREAVAGGADEWASYAQDKLDRELRACSLLLTDDHVLLLHRYAAVLRVDPQELLAALLAPEAARRERFWRRGKAFARAHVHAPRPPRGCLALAVWPAALVGFWTLAWTLAQWALGILPLLVHR